MTHQADEDFSLHLLWSSLPGGACCTPFQSPCFLSAFRNTIASRRGLRFFITEIRSADTGSTVALFPFAVYRRGPVRVACMPDMGLADQVAPVLAKDCPIPDSDFAAIWEMAVDGLSGVDVIDIAKIVPQIGCRDNPLRSMSCAVSSGEMLTLDLAAQAASEWRRKSVYKTVRSKEKRLAEAGVTFFQTQDYRECLPIFEALKLQRSRRFRSIGRTDSLETQPGYAEFYRQLASEASPGGSVTAFCLKTDDEIVAAYLAFADREAINGVLVSIGDDKWHNCSPGMVLTAKVIEWAMQEGLKTFFFGTGMQEYKARFGGTPVPMYRYSRSLTPVGKLFLVARQLRNETLGTGSARSA